MGVMPSAAASVNFLNGLSDNNEATNTVTIGRLKGGVSVSGQIVNFTIPAFSAVVLLQADAQASGHIRPN
jgi:hypothetical protein